MPIGGAGEPMILLGLGSNVGGPWGSPGATLRRALSELESADIAVAAVSRLYLTAPFGRTNQPAFVNAVAAVRSHLPPPALLERCHRIERAAGRIRRQRWGPRTLDIDLLDYRGRIATNAGMVRSDLARPLPLSLPHPGIAERAFVLVPLDEIAPFWHHPVTGATARQLLLRLGHRIADQIISCEDGKDGRARNSSGNRPFIFRC